MSTVDAPQGTPAFVVCGDNPLACDWRRNWSPRPGDHVTVLLRSRERNYGPRIGRLPNVRVVEAAEFDDAALRAAGVEEAEALALVDQDDVSNIHTALRAQELNRGLRLVIRSCCPSTRTGRTSCSRLPRESGANRAPPLDERGAAAGRCGCASRSCSIGS
ncbi:NAD-binding protein [Pseudonocardia sp. H11422]|uniref:NAD-binding protein n=1 Tax=Pseudonocardia sp. H11422 TaxID=2835866 RepID=UPI001BDD31EA|nr:NAD-binding protein [Pseudonocardia sp. H11422]